jgi:hypothetical protein
MHVIPQGPRVPLLVDPFAMRGVRLYRTRASLFSDRIVLNARTPWRRFHRIIPLHDLRAARVSELDLLVLEMTDGSTVEIGVPDPEGWRQFILDSQICLLGGD